MEVYKVKKFNALILYYQITISIAFDRFNRAFIHFKTLILNLFLLKIYGNAKYWNFAENMIHQELILQYQTDIFCVIKQ